MKQLHSQLIVITLLLIFSNSHYVHAKEFDFGNGKHQEDNSNEGKQAISLLKEAERADQIGDAGKALTLLRQAAAMEIPNNVIRIRVFQKLGGAESTAGNLREALAAREMARNLTGSGKHLSGKRLMALTHEVDLQLKLGDTDEAKKSLAGAERDMSWARFNKQNYAKFLGSLEQGRGDIAQAEGRYVDAESAFRRSLKAFEDFRTQSVNSEGEDDILPDSESKERSIENVLTKLSIILQIQGRLAEAELYARQLVDRAQARQGKNSFAAGRGHRMMSVILAERGRYTDAEHEAQMAIDDLKAAGVLPYSFNMVHAQQALAIALAGQEKWRDAANVFAQARDALKEDPLLEAKFGLGNPHWALTLIQIGKSERAIGMLEKMLAKQLKLQPETAFQPSITRGLLGLAQYSSGQEELAEASFRLSIPVMLENLHQLDSEDQGASASEIMIRKIVDGYIDLLMHRYQSHRSVVNGDPLDLAFRYADMASAGAVRRALAASAARSALGNGELAEMIRSEQDMSQRISSFGQTVERLSGMSDPQLVQNTIESMRQDIEQTRSARAKLRNDIMRKFPSYASLINPRTPGMTEIAKLLKPDEVFVSIHPADHKTYIWAMRSGQQPSYAIVDLSLKELDGVVDRLRKALDPGEVSLAQTPAFDVGESHQLFLHLFGPIEKSLAGAKQLIVVTPGPLGRLPLSLLVTAPPVAPDSAITGKELFMEYKKVPWLIRRYALISLPSAANFPALRLNLTPPAKQAFAGFGDPLFSANQTSGARTRGVSRLRKLTFIKNDSAIPNPERPGIISSEISLLPQLPETRNEILAMANALHADLGRDVFLEAAANEVAVRQSGLGDRRVIAFSTHGLIPGELSGLDSPALALTAPELASLHDPDDNGFLTLEKILPLKLNAEWVVLSACNTAAGQGAGAEAFSGLGRAFFFAGARSILVSHWPVESQSTERLITTALRYYAADQSAGRAEALRRAELEMIDSEPVTYGDQKFSLAHPMFWSAFSLVGEGGTQ